MAKIKITPAVFIHINSAVAVAGTSDPEFDRLHRRLEQAPGPVWYFDSRELELLSWAVADCQRRLAAGQLYTLDRDRDTPSVRASLAFAFRRLAAQLGPAGEGGQRWVCPACHSTVVTLIPVAQPPTCSNHTGGGRLMAAS